MRRWVIVAESGTPGTPDFKYSPRFGPFNGEAEAAVIARRLNQGASSSTWLSVMPAERRPSDDEHSAQLSAALEVLRELDPQASPTDRYVVHAVDSFAPPVQAGQHGTSPTHAAFRGYRDLGT